MKPSSSSESSSIVKWGVAESAQLVALSDNEAKEKLLAGEVLENLAISTLNLAGCEIKKPVVIRNCQIGKINFLATTFKDTLQMVATTVTESTWLSHKDKEGLFQQSRFHRPVQIQNCLFQGNFSCIKALFHGEVTVHGKFEQGSFFNYSIFEKDTTFSESQFAGKLEVIQCHFQGMSWWRYLRCDEQASFRRCIFEMKFNLRESHFASHLFLSYISVKQRIGANVITCEGNVEFDHSVFLSEFSSKGAEYLGRVSLRFCQAHENVFLQNSVFHQQISLANIQLAGTLQATGAEFRGRFVLDKARCNGEINFQGVVFQQGFLCRGAVLGNEEGHLHFAQAEFCREADFEGSNFHSTMDFANASFKGKTSFRRCLLGMPGEVISFKKAQFLRRTGFDRAHFLTRTVFEQCHFARQVGFSRVTFENLVSFADTVFEDKATFCDGHFAKQSFFYGTSWQEADFTDTEFEGAVRFSAEENVARSQEQKPATFAKDAFFVNTRFIKKAIFQGVEFLGQARFNQAYFGEQASFRRTVAKSDINFGGVFCSLELDLRRMQVRGELLLRGGNINRRINLADAGFAGIAFYNMVTDVIALTPEQVKGKLRGERNKSKDPVEMERTAQEYLALKRSFAYQGMYEEEDWAYWHFRRYSRKASTLQARKKWQGLALVKNLLQRIFLDYGSSYGTHPLRITLLALLLIVGFGGFYWCFPDQLILEGREILEGDEASFVQCVYFSTMAFTTMGFGDIHPDFHGWLKGVVALEALIGIITMTLFVGTYARKIIR